MVRAKLPVLESRPLINPEMVPQVGFLGGDEGKLVHEEIQRKYSQFFAINQVSYKNNLAQGSTPFYVVAVNEIIRLQGFRVATLADLENILKLNALDLTCHYEDSALVLRSEKDPNSYLAQNLMKQIRVRNPEVKMPVMIPLAGLSLVQDSGSDYGLTFTLRGDAEMVYAEILNSQNGSFSPEGMDASIGLPRKLGKGNMTLYTRKEGLSRLYLYRDSDLYSGGEGLAGLGGNGRVVVVDGKTTANNSEAYIFPQIEQELIETGFIHAKKTI